MADSTVSPEPTCDVDGTCYCPLTGVITTLSRKYAMQLVSIIGAHDSLRFAEVEEHLPGASTSTISKRLDEFQEAGLVSRTQYDEIATKVYEIVSGGADGVDQLGEQYTKKWDIPCTAFHPNWDELGQAAGPARNRHMAEYADTPLALWDGESSGTRND